MRQVKTRIATSEISIRDNLMYTRKYKHFYFSFLSFYASIIHRATLMSLRKLADTAKSFDAFPKVEDDNQQRSEKGGFLTVIVALCLFLLTMSEFSE